MGNTVPILGDNQDVSYESGGSRLGTAICVALCVAPILIMVSLFFVGWNEKRAVCDDKVIAKGEDEVQMLGCTEVSQGDGALVMLNCNLHQYGLVGVNASGDFASKTHIGTGLSTVTEMLQCVESSSKQTTSTVGGGKQTITTYTYNVQWEDKPIDSLRFRKKESENFRRNCGVENPGWGPEIPRTGKTYAPSIRFGNFTTDEPEFISAVPLSSLVEWPAPVPPGWTTQPGSGVYETQVGAPNAQNIGKVRTRFQSNDWARTDVTVLGQNNGGNIGKWTGPRSWLCEGFQLGTLRAGTLSKDEIFEALRAEAKATTWLLRIGCFLVLWCAFACCFGPLEIMADCIPFCGDCLSSCVQAVACAVACVPASACCCFVAGIMWVVMRPLWGIAMLTAASVLVLSLACGYFIFAKNSSDSEAKGEGTVFGTAYA